MEPSVVSSFPTTKFNQHLFVSSEDNLCTICLGDYKEKEILRILPRCGHAFHIACIDTWLRQHHTCPVCRVSLQVFSEWRQMTAPLLSLAAKARFVPGAFPDHLFEKPKNDHEVPVGVSTEAPKENLGLAVAGTDEQDLEAGESSGLRRQVSQRQGRGEVESGDRQQLLEPRVNMGLDASSHSEVHDLQVESGDRQRLLESRGNMDLDALPWYDTLELPAITMHGTLHSRHNVDITREGISSAKEPPSHMSAAHTASHAAGLEDSISSTGQIA